jgi:hypothetical protein
MVASASPAHSAIAAIDRALASTAAAANLHLRLVHGSAISNAMPAGPGGVGKQRREPQHPPTDGDVVGLDPTLSQEFLDVAI